jgi:Zn-dependent protease with chaperone function
MSPTRRTLRILLNLYIPAILAAPAVPLLLGLVGLVAGRLSMAFSRPLGGLFTLFSLVMLLTGAVAAIQLAFFLLEAQKIRRAKDDLVLRLPAERLRRVYRFVDEIAQHCDLPAPDEICLHAGTAAYATETKRGKRILALGGMALVSLPQDALAAVVAHELGHFAGDDTRLFHQERSGFYLMQVIEQALAQNLGHWCNPAIAGLALFHRIVIHLRAKQSRECEYLADAEGARLVGKKVTGAALVYLHVVDHLPWANLERLLENMVMCDDPSFNVFQHQVSAARSATEKTWRSACRRALDEPTRPLDDHPCLTERLDALGIGYKEALTLLLDQSAPTGSNLIDNWEEIEVKLGKKIGVIYYVRHKELQEMHAAYRRF